MTRFSLFFAAALAMAPVFQAEAGSVNLTSDSGWQLFDADNTTSLSGGLEWIDNADGSVLTFNVTLTQPTWLQVVDGGFAGDQFEVFDNGVSLGFTSSAINTYPTSVALDFDAAWADANYSQASFLLAPGVHAITGVLSLSALDDSTPTPLALNATSGAVRLPEPAGISLFLLGAGLLRTFARRARKNLGA